MFSLNVFTVNDLTAERDLTVGTAKLNQHKDILTSKFESNNMLFW